MFKLSRKAKALLSGGSSKEDNKGAKGGSSKSVDSFSFGTNHHLLLTAEEREALREELKRLNDNLSRVNQDDNNDKVCAKKILTESLGQHNSGFSVHVWQLF